MLGVGPKAVEAATETLRHKRKLLSWIDERDLHPIAQRGRAT